MDVVAEMRDSLFILLKIEPEERRVKILYSCCGGPHTHESKKNQAEQVHCCWKRRLFLVKKRLSFHEINKNGPDRSLFFSTKDNQLSDSAIIKRPTN